MPTISVIVPVYNVEGYLIRCVESILAQTFADYELILIDDGSTDNCGKICDEYALKDRRVKVVHKENAGVSRARNTGIDLATGEFISFIDSDDFIKYDFLETLYKEISSNQADCVASGFIERKGDVDCSKIEFEPSCKLLNNSNDRFSYIVHDVLGGKVGWEIWTRLFRTSIIKSNGIRMCETCDNFAEDLGFFLVYILHCKKIINLNYSGYYYSLRDNSMMQKSLGIIKLNEVNEVSKWFFVYIDSYNHMDFIKHYYIIHFWILRNQLEKIIELGCYDSVPYISKSIKDRKWYAKYLWKAVCHINNCFGDTDTNERKTYRNLCFYTLHNNKTLFRFSEYLTWKI